MVRSSNSRSLASELLKILRGNARAKFTELAKRLGVSEAAVRKTLKKLRDQGVILRFVTEVDYRKLGKVEALVGVNVRPEKLVHVLDDLKSSYQNIDIIYVTSGDHDIIIHGVFENLDELKGFCEDLEALEGVEAVYPSTVIEKLFKI